VSLVPCICTSSKPRRNLLLIFDPTRFYSIPHRATSHGKMQSNLDLAPPIHGHIPHPNHESPIVTNPTHACTTTSQILPTRRPATSRRHADPHPTRNRARRPRPGRVNSALDQADRRQDPIATTALHALPSVLADVGMAFGTLETAVELALLELGPHPG
jgi:hypothetical protein